MQGRITKYDDRLSVGIIEAENGRRFLFKPDAVVNPNGRLVGYEVDFVASSVQRPRDIILMTGSPWSVFTGREAL